MGYIYLAFAIFGELVGTTFLKYAAGFTKLWPSIGCLISYMVCFIFLSKSLPSIKLSIAYATWSGIGIVAATLLSILLFHERINYIGVLGILLVLLGVILLNLYGSAH